MRTALEDLGLAAIAVGVALISLPAGIIVAGLLTVLAANLHDASAPRKSRAAVRCQCGHDKVQHLIGLHQCQAGVCSCMHFSPSDEADS